MTSEIKLDAWQNIAIDPGNQGSGWVIWVPDDTTIGGLQVLAKGRSTNRDLRQILGRSAADHRSCHLQIEAPRPRGMPTSAEEMEMMIQLGRTLQMWRGPWTYVFRQSAKINLCGSARAKDGNVTQAIKDRFGGDSVAVGGVKCRKCKGTARVGRARCPQCLRATTKNNDCEYCRYGKRKSIYEKEECECGDGWEQKPGPLHGFASHEWAALAVALYWLDMGGENVQQIAGQQNLKKQQQKWSKKR